MTIRLARPHEGERLRHVAVAAKSHWGYDRARVEACAAAGNLSPEMLRDKQVYVSELDGQLVAWTALARRGEPCWLDQSLGRTGMGRARRQEPPLARWTCATRDEPSAAAAFSQFSASTRRLPRVRILVVDDEPAVRASLERALRLEGYEVDVAADGREALAHLANGAPDAIVLDVVMPHVDGLEVCRRLRSLGDRTPVLVLTARDAVTDRVAGLDAGADDYLVKPFALEELLARVRALLRRTAPDGGQGMLRFADLTLDERTYEVRRGERRLDLTKTEFLLLELFLRNPRQVLTRSLIFERVWGYDFGPASNSLEVYVGYLRRKTEAGGDPRLIHTVRGVGYALREP